MKIELWNIENWERDKSEIMAIENVFSEELRMDEQEVYDSIKEGQAIVAIDEKIVGITYFVDYSKIDFDWFQGYFEPKNYSKYIENKSVYITSTAVLPEYRNQEIAIQLRVFMINYLRKNGYKYIVAHSHKGIMTNIVQIFGGKVIDTFKKWYGGKETHMFYELPVSETIINYVPKIKQETDYDCALASLKTVLGDRDYHLPMNKDVGTSHETIVLTLIRMKITFVTQYNCDISFLRKAIREYYTPIVNYTDGEGHYSVVMGISDDFVFIRDVWDGKIYKYKISRFEKIWYSKMYGYRWMLIV